MTVTNHK